MAIPVTLPALGESVTEGTVTRWLKQIGDTVEVDEPLLEVSTDKVDTEIPSPVAGVLLEITVAEDETAEIGAALAVIGVPDAAAPPSEPVVQSPVNDAPAPVAPPQPLGAPPVLATRGSATPGPGVTDSGRQVPVEASSLRGRTVTMTRIRKVIGDKLKKALLEQAQLTTVVEVDVTRLMRLRAGARGLRGP